MSRLRGGVVRFASVATDIASALGVDPAPDCHSGRGRITITFRRIGASRWSEREQIEHALHVATVARRVLANDSRPKVRDRITRAIVVVYEDAALVRGCDVLAKWECVVPA